MSKNNKTAAKAEPAKLASQDTFRKIFDLFDAPITGEDCGQHCMTLNDGVPVCCDTQNAVPIMHEVEYKLIKSRSKLWKRFKPYDKHTQGIVDEIADTVAAVECKGCHKCERDNRSLACRAFPFFAYFTKDKKLLGLTYYWDFEDTCWVISNMKKVSPGYIKQFLKAYEILFADDPEERDVLIDHSADMRRVFSRRKQDIPILTKDGKVLLVKPKGGGVVKGKKKDLPQFAPFAPFDQKTSP